MPESNTLEPSDFGYAGPKTAIHKYLDDNVVPTMSPQERLLLNWLNWSAQGAQALLRLLDRKHQTLIRTTGRDLIERYPLLAAGLGAEFWMMFLDIRPASMSEDWMALVRSQRTELRELLGAPEPQPSEEEVMSSFYEDVLDSFTPNGPAN